MTAPDTPDIWADGAGANIVTSLTAIASEWQANTTDSRVQYALIRVSFSGSPNLSAVMPGHRLVVPESGFTNPENNGSFYITAADNTAKTVTIRTATITRMDDSLDETGASVASVSITNGGSRIQEPSSSKQAQGYVEGEKPNSAQFNWLFNNLTTVARYLMQGGALPTYATLAALKAENASDGVKALLFGRLYQFVEGDSTTADDYNSIADDAAAGRWLLQIATNRWKTITASQAVVPGERYVTNSGSRIDLTLPATSLPLAENEVANRGTGGFRLLLNTGQTLRYNNTEYVYGQGLSSSDAYASARLLCTASNEFTLLNAQGTLSAATVSGAGYVAGGVNSGNTVQTTIYKLAYPTETSSTLGATLDTARQLLTGAQSSTKGYFVGGVVSGGATTNLIDDLTFATELSVQISATLGRSLSEVGAGQSGSAAYFFGGSDGGSAYNEIEKFVFAGETRSTLAATLQGQRTELQGLSATSYAYALGGTNNSSTPQSTIDKFTLSNDTAAALGASLPATRYRGACVQRANGAGYLMGGTVGGSGDATSIAKFSFATETASTLSATLDTGKEGAAGTSGPAKGYAYGGHNSGSGQQTAIEDLDLVTETSAAISATLASARAYQAGVWTIG